MAQGNAQVFQRSLLNDIAHGQVALPLTFVASGGSDVRAAFVHSQETQAKNSDPREIIPVANLPGSFSGALELADHRLRHEKGGGAVTLVQPDRVAVAADLL